MNRHHAYFALLLFGIIAIAMPRPSHAVECTAHVDLESGNEHIMTGELSATASASDPYPHHRSANVDVGLFGVRCYALCENNSTSSTYLYVLRSYGEFKLTNVVFSSEGTEPVPVALNLDLDGRFNLYDQAGTYALGKVIIEATINGTTFPGEIHVCTRYCVEVQLGLLDGVMGRNYSNRRLTTPTVVVPVNQPVTVAISMNVVIGVDSHPPARGEGVFDQTYTFARSGPVFNVPAGIDVDSEHAVIVDNAYYSGNTIPTAPSTWGSIKALYR